MKIGEHINDLNQNLNTGFYVATNGAAGMPQGVSICPLLVFKVEKESSIQLLFFGDKILFRTLWKNSFLHWHMCLGKPVVAI